MEQHGGRITVESGAERGTTFTITLPALAEDPAAAAATDDPTLFTGQGETVLIVEDEVPVRHTLAQILGDLNYHVLAAPSAEDAVTVYDAHAGEVALVLTDLVMPGMGGIGLLRALRERACRAPIVMMSGYVGEAASETITGVSAWVAEARVGAPTRPDHPGSAHRPGLIAPDARTLGRWGRMERPCSGTASPPSGPPCSSSSACCSRSGGLVFAAAAVALDMPWGSLTGQAVLERALAAVVLVISGLLAGAPFIVLGEMMRLFIDLRRLAARQHRLLRRMARRADQSVGSRPGGLVGRRAPASPPTVNRGAAPRVVG